LAQQRLRVAKELLRESNLAVAEIAYQVGYQDGSHFSRLFKKLLGQTPKQYRDTVRGKLFSLAEKTL
jgi:transcriptional regulator GlxA family with amidase domain